MSKASKERMDDPDQRANLASKMTVISIER
jgi:hypothetical protein